MTSAAAGSDTTLDFEKLVGTGNDFVFIDGRKTLPSWFEAMGRARMASWICNRHTGVGADGVVFIDRATAPDENGSSHVKWDFYNSDGSIAEMCGNASRCAGRWAERHLKAQSIQLETLSGVVRVEVFADYIRAHLSELKLIPENLPFALQGNARSAILINTSVPHAVLALEDLEQAALSQDAIQALRWHKKAGARGANVTFYQRVSDTEVKTVTFERGVEGFTLSCGTGVVAAATAAYLENETRGLRHRHLVVVAPGGRLGVEFAADLTSAVLTGPAQFVFSGFISNFESGLASGPGSKESLP